MKIAIYRADGVPGYTIHRALRRHRGPGRWRILDSGSILVQSDWDFPGLARNYGWSPRRAATRHQNRICSHAGTDGTVDCTCGLTVGRMIESAANWIDQREGRVVDNPGYFEGD